MKDLLNAVPLKHRPHMLYLLPWSYRGWSYQFPFLHIGRLHFCFHKMGRSVESSFWLPNISVTYGRKH